MTAPTAPPQQREAAATPDVVGWARRAATTVALPIGSAVWLVALITLSPTARDVFLRVPEAFLTILRVVQRRLSVPARLRGMH